MSPIHNLHYMYWAFVYDNNISVWNVQLYVTTHRVNRIIILKSGSPVMYFQIIVLGDIQTCFGLVWWKIGWIIMTYTSRYCCLKMSRFLASPLKAGTTWLCNAGFNVQSVLIIIIYSLHTQPARVIFPLIRPRHYSLRCGNATFLKLSRIATNSHGYSLY